MSTDVVTLYAGSGSPFVWKVWLALEHKGVPYTLKMLSFSAGDTRSPEFRAINPRGKVPAIEHEGLTLWESTAILEYLEDRFPTPPLWPADLQARARARRLVSENDAYLYPIVRRIVAETLFKPADQTDLEALTAARTELKVELLRLAEALEGDYLAGALSGADFSLFPSLAFIDRIEARAPQHGLAADLPPALRAYLDRMIALPVVQKTWPPHWRA